MKKVVDISLKVGKILVFALFAAQYVFAIWWVLKNILVIPDFQLASESYVYKNVSSYMGSFFWLIYLAQVVAMFWGIKELFPKNLWIARFSITNPLIIQFVFALTPDVFCVAILLALLAPVLHGENIKGKHIIFLFLLGMLSSVYFFAGIFVLLVLGARQYIRTKNKDEKQNNSKKKMSNRLMAGQILLVIVLLLVSYQTRGNENNAIQAQQGMVDRFTIDENIPSNHSVLSVAKGSVTDTLYMIMEPFTYIQVMEQKILTQNGWNYVNFTREEPRISKYYMELSERNLFLALAVTVLTWMLSLAFTKRKQRLDSKSILYLGTCIGICILFTVVTKRGVDYRTGLFIIPVWYGVILSWFHEIKILPCKGGIKDHANRNA